MSGSLPPGVTDAMIDALYDEPPPRCRECDDAGCPACEGEHSTPANEWLIANGHNNGGSCEKCWREAAVRYAMGHGGYESQTSAYYAAMDEAQRTAARTSRSASVPETDALEPEERV